LALLPKASFSSPPFWTRQRGDDVSPSLTKGNKAIIRATFADFFLGFQEILLISDIVPKNMPLVIVGKALFSPSNRQKPTCLKNVA
jgi:hypothetical protein